MYFYIASTRRNSGLCKVGITTKPHKRLQDLRCKYFKAKKVYYDYFFDCGDINVAKEIEVQILRHWKKHDMISDKMPGVEFVETGSDNVYFTMQLIGVLRGARLIYDKNKPHKEFIEYLKSV